VEGQPPPLCAAFSSRPETLLREPIDLASERLRGYVLAANDEFFGKRENLLKHEEPAFSPDDFGPNGISVDGWQTRRRRQVGYDWAIIRLGVPGVVEEVVVDTTHFTGNHPTEASLEGCVAAHNALPGELTEWAEIIPRSDLGGDRKNHFQVNNRHRFTHLRLNIFPDGGVARLRVLGQPVPNWMAPGTRLTTDMDLAALVNGGHVHSVSDTHYGDLQNLIKPGLSTRMDQGWLTRRRREDGQDWAILRLVGPGTVRSITLDTAHFEGNCPEKCHIEASLTQDPKEDDWFELLPPQTTVGHTEHHFHQEILPNSDVLWIRLNVLPDGGVARLRVWGTLSEDGYEQARLLFLNSSREATLKAIFKHVCHSQRWIDIMTASAPYLGPNDILKKGARAWSKCSEADWREALQGHPRIGDKAKGKSLSANWSKGEQSQAKSPDSGIIKKLKATQERYFQKFQFIFLICATGKSSEEILAAVEKRLQNSAQEELQIVAEEQSKIIHLRLEKLLKS
jgi:allantoicase